MDIIRGVVDYESNPEYCGYRIRLEGESAIFNSGEGWAGGSGLLSALVNKKLIGKTVEISIRVIEDDN